MIYSILGSNCDGPCIFYSSDFSRVHDYAELHVWTGRPTLRVSHRIMEWKDLDALHDKAFTEEGGEIFPLWELKDGGSL